jgi:hypothetical protein
MERVVVWRGLDAARMEIAHVEAAGAEPRVRGTQIGVAYELRYELAGARLTLELAGERALELELLPDTDFFDLGYSPLFNSLPVWRDALIRGGPARDYVMRFVRVPELTAVRSNQHYEPLGGRVVRYSSDSFSANIEFDEDGFVTRYADLFERVS